MKPFGICVVSGREAAVPVLGEASWGVGAPLGELGCVGDTEESGGVP